MLSKGISLVNGQDQIVQSGNYWYASFKVGDFKWRKNGYETNSNRTSRLCRNPLHNYRLLRQFYQFQWWIGYTTFYYELSPLARHISKPHVLIIGGDMNAQITKDKNNKFCLHNLPTRNGEYLTDFFPSFTVSHAETLNKKGSKIYGLHLSKKC